MRPEDLYDAIGGIKEEYIEESESLGKEQPEKEPAGTVKPVFRLRKRLPRILAAAAAIVLLIGVVRVAGRRMGSSTPAMETAEMKSEDAMEAAPAEAAEAAPAEAAAEAGGMMEDAEMADAEAKEAGMEEAGMEEAAEEPAAEETGSEMKTAEEQEAAMRLSDAFVKEAAARALVPDDGENHAWSPVNIAAALAMLAETTDGETQKQILDAFGVSSLEELRASMRDLNALRRDDEGGVCLPAASIWLRDTGTEYDPEVLKNLKEIYEASAFTGEMGSPEYDKKLQSWINENTKGLLEAEAGNLHLDPETLLALVSTIYYHADWSEPFEDHQVGEEVFHAPSGDRKVTMLHTGFVGSYRRGEHFGAVSLGLRDGNSFWFLLPDEGYSVSDILGDPAAAKILTQDPAAEENEEYAQITLQFPKFDIVSDTDLKETFRALGVSDVFDASKADFSPLLGKEEALLSSAEHAARVAVDEYGVTAAAFTIEILCGAAMPPEKQINFICDRPFVFAVADYDGFVYFEGVVNEP